MHQNRLNCYNTNMFPWLGRGGNNHQIIDKEQKTMNVYTKDLIAVEASKVLSLKCGKCDFNYINRKIGRHRKIA